MAASLVRTAGLPDFVVHSLAEFEQKAVELAGNAAALAAARSKLMAGRTQSPLFDSVRFAAELEDSLLKAWSESTGHAVPAPVVNQPVRRPVPVAGGGASPVDPREAARPIVAPIAAAAPSRPAPATNGQRLLIRGWRGINHSFALVNQQQIIEMLREPGLQIFHEDMPTPLKSWHDGKVQAGFPAAEDAAIQALPPPDGGRYDAVLTLAAPFAPLSVRGNRRTAMFAVTELGPGENSFAAGFEDPALYCRSEDEFIVTPTRWSRDRLAEYGFPESRIHIVPHGVRTDLFRPLSLNERNAVRKQVGYQPDEFVFLNLGGMFWNKGPDLLIRAFAAVHRAAGSRHVRLLLKDQRGLYQQTADTILQQVVAEFPGLVTEEVRQAITVLPGNLKMGELRMVYGAADAYVSPYRAEGFNLPVLEAMACGLPVLATEGGATDDFLHVGHGIPVRSRAMQMEGIRSAPRRFREPDLDDLVEKMLALVHGPASRGGQPLAPEVSHALSGWSWAAASSRLLELLDLRAPPAQARVA
jgi:glycosyltransferase involved in cell wall biosynthesis